MKLDRNTARQLAILEEAETEDLFQLIEAIGEDPVTFFDLGYWKAIDFSAFDMRGVRFLGACVIDCRFHEGDVDGYALPDSRVFHGNLHVPNPDWKPRSGKGRIEPLSKILDIKPGANLTGANLTKAKLMKANLTGANLTGANLEWANLTKANLTRANLTRANLTKANLTGANLTKANLRGANLTKANLTRANFTKANLRAANLTGANLEWANLTWANLTRANLTSMLHASEIYGLEQARRLDEAELPAGWTVTWSKKRERWDIMTPAGPWVDPRKRVIT